MCPLLLCLNICQLYIKLLLDVMEKFLQIVGNIQNKYNTIPFLYVIIGSTFLTFMQICIKFLTYYISLFEIIYLRSVFLILFNTYILHLSKHTVYIPNSRTYKLVVSRMFVSFVSVYCYFYPVKYIPLGILNSIWMIGPLITHILQSIVMKTKLNRIDFLITLVCFSGIILIVKPEFLFGKVKQISNIFCYFVLVLGTIFNGISMIIIRLFKDDIKNDTSLQYFYIGQIINSSLNLLIFQQDTEKKPLTLNFFLLIIFLIFTAYIAQMSITRSVFLMPAAKVMPFNYTGVIIGFFFDINLFHRKFDWIQLCGVLITSIGLIYMAIRKTE